MPKRKPEESAKQENAKQEMAQGDSATEPNSQSHVSKVSTSKLELTDRQISRLEEQLQRAIIAGRTARVRTLLHSHPWLIETTFEYDDIDQTYGPLHLAALYGKKALIKLLINSGADVLARTSGGQLPLYYAASYDPPPLHYAAKMTRALLEAMRSAIPDEKEQADILVETIGQLLEDYDKGAFAMRVLDAAEANLDAHDAQGRTPLHRAVMAGNIDAFDMLHELGAEPDPADKAGNTPLHLAVWSGSVVMVAIALGQECEPLHRNDEGVSPYHAALEREDFKMLGLFQRHPDVRAYSDGNGSGNDSNTESGEEFTHYLAEVREELREHYRTQRNRTQRTRQQRQDNQREKRPLQDTSESQSDTQSDTPNEWFWDEEDNEE